MSFWGLTLKAGQKHPVESTEGDILHLSQACLHAPKGGKTYLQVTDNEKTYVIACLEKDKVEHASFDLFFSTGSCTFSTKGDSEVHLTGYFEPVQDMGEESEEEDELPEAALPLKKSPAVQAKKSPVAAPAKSPVAAPAKSPKLAAKAAAVEEEDDDDDEEGESDLEGEEEEEEMEDSEEEEAAPPAKKRKAEEPAAAPPAKKAAAGGSSAPTDAYIKLVQKFLEKNGKSKIAMIGTKVQRPKEVPKLKAILEQNKDKFTLNGEDVELKK